MNTFQLDAMSRLIAVVEESDVTPIHPSPINAEQIDAYIVAKHNADCCNKRLQDAAEPVARLPRGVYVGTLGAIVVTEEYQLVHPRIWVEHNVVVAADIEAQR